MMGPHTYAMEAAQVMLSAIVLLVKLFVAWQNSRDVKYAASAAQRILSMGRLRASIWHVLLIAIMTWIALFAASNPPPPGPGHFWDAAQVTTGRLLFMTLIVCHGMMIVSVQWSYRKMRHQIT